MPENQPLRDRLEQLLSHKKSRKYYAKKLGVSEDDVREELHKIRNKIPEDCVVQMANYICDLEDTIVKLDEDIKKGTAELNLKVKDEIKTLEELIEKGKIDTTKWNIDRYVQNYWGNSKEPHWQVKAYLSVKTQQENFHKDFTEFLKNYKPIVTQGRTPARSIPALPNACLIINKQDEHINKLDVNGSNNIHQRFNIIHNKINRILNQADGSTNLSEIIYVIGSDQFNSEWTSATTRGTPQQNLLPYQESFQIVCDFEIETIQLLQQFSNKVHIIYMPGNHDEYVGWHLIHWLQAFYRDNRKVGFDISTKYTKFVSYGKSAMMFNHGDAIKPEKLVGMFPVLYKERWSDAENYYVFTGDKHHEVSKDINGVKFYQLPALSGSKSLWDEKNGHVCSPPELTAFLIEEQQGMTAIYKQKL